jgi:nucleotide-binding universal stress UspA family protein
MENPKHILVPVDFSSASGNALQYALKFADKSKQSILVLHVVYPQMESFDYPIFSGSATKTKSSLAEIALADFVDKHLTELKLKAAKDFEIHRLVKVGSAIPVIQDLVSEIMPLMLIMGTEGESAKQKKLMGSITAGILNKSSVPVLSIPPEYHYKRIDRIAFASDFKESDVVEIKKYGNLLSSFNPSLHFVHIQSEDVDENEESNYLKKLKASIEANLLFKAKEYHIISGEDISQELLKFSKENNIDMIALNKPTRSWFKRFFIPSTSREMVLHSKIPVLVLRPGE